jgi:electron transfer flavoprotein-quinone oxidoreductase
MIDRFKAHPQIAPLIKGGETLEYSAHLVPEGGYSMIPELVWNGVLVAGDAAGFVINMGYTFRGMDFAIESGRLAAQAVIKAKEIDDFSEAGLSYYRTLLDQSFVMRDLKHYKEMPALMDNRQIYNDIPKLFDEILGSMFIVDGSEPEKITRSALDAIRETGDVYRLIKLGARALTTV